jgi:hypothetical protein
MSTKTKRQKGRRSLVITAVIVIIVVVLAIALVSPRESQGPTTASTASYVVSEKDFQTHVVFNLLEAGGGLYSLRLDWITTHDLKEIHVRSSTLTLLNLTFPDGRVVPVNINASDTEPQTIQSGAAYVGYGVFGPFPKPTNAKMILTIYVDELAQPLRYKFDVNITTTPTTATPIVA